MLYLIDITWNRRTPETDRPKTGVETVAMAGRSFTVAKGKAVRKFNLHFGMHLAIQKVTEKQDPAQIHQDGYKRIDCGSGQHFGICRKCGKGHGTVLMERGVFSKGIPA
jgi:hypothetical protein